jgi:hypothetical protein
MDAVRAFVVPTIASLALPFVVATTAHADSRDPVEQLQADRLPSGTIRWFWSPTASYYEIIGDALPVQFAATSICRTPEDADPTDTVFDDPVIPEPGSGEWLLVCASGSCDSGAGGENRPYTSCDMPDAYFCVVDAAGDSFVLKLTDDLKINHARNVIRGTEQELVHVGATTTGGPVPWNPGWQFHIPPEAVFFFANALEICDASIAAVDQGGPPASTWCPWTSQIMGELYPPEQWQDSTPAPFYCGPAN